MSSYAQTYLQLHHQIHRLGYSEDDRQYLRQVYEFGMQIFSGYVQGYGKSFLSHGIGTASVLASLRTPIQLVAAGLIHNVYASVDFRDGEKGIVPAHQDVIIEAVGKKAQAYLASFNTLCWAPDVFDSIRDQLTEYDHVTRMAVLLYLADHVEHNLDHGTLYFFEEESTWRRRNFTVLVDMASILGYPMLGKEIQHVHQEHEGVQIPNEFKPLHKPAIKRKLAPRSCRRGYALPWKQKFAGWLRWLQRITVASCREVRLKPEIVKN